LKSNDFPYGASVRWVRTADWVSHWHEISIWSTETFGLPGDRYIVDFNVNDMTWWFGTADDRLIFLLRNGTAKLVDQNLIDHERVC
jgi:hypothetical protein